MMESERGNPWPLGAHWQGDGTNFAVFAENATGVDLCLFDEPGDEKESDRIRLKDYSHGVWHGFLSGVRPGQLYGFRVYGRYAPEDGLRFNPSKLLLDPYAKAITGGVEWDPSIFGYGRDQKKADMQRDYRDSAGHMPKSVVVDDAFDWEDVEKPRTPWSDTVIYETHVKGLTKQHPSIGEHEQGTYAALGREPVIQYLKDLGVTAVELLPVHQHLDEGFLHERGLTNYWGYSSIGFFAPEFSYASSGSRGEQVREFKEMVRNLHAAGLEVILDVVYNHTGEGNHLGPTVCFRGVDNLAYYRLEENRRYYLDVTGTGNTVLAPHPRVLQLILDSLRYWVVEMGVDGFRFDLATALGREYLDFNPRAAFFQAILQDPVLSKAKLIAEPWDIGWGGYQVGGFPPPWSEWNGRYRDDLRRYWKGDRDMVGRLASRLAGSQDIYGPSRRPPTASVNFITSHDGFTMRDLVSYNQKHNEANREGNRDGDNHNSSWNCGVEGPTDDPDVLALRGRLHRSFLATLFVSQGVPMLLGGDEFGRTQKGNNNAYCQDNEISWYHWNNQEAGAVDTPNGQDLLNFTRSLAKLRRDHPIFRRTRFFDPESHDSCRPREILWLNRQGQEMTYGDWRNTENRVLGVILHGRTEEASHTQSPPPMDVTFLLIFNAEARPVTFRMPGRSSTVWQLELDTTYPTGKPEESASKTMVNCGETVEVNDRTVCLYYLAEGDELEAIKPCKVLRAESPQSSADSMPAAKPPAPKDES